MKIQRAPRDHQAELLLKALEQGIEISWIAHGESMYPSIPSGSLVTICPLEPNKIKRGEVGLFILEHTIDGEDTQTWILHRVLKNDRRVKVIHTRGDRLPHSDTPFSYMQCAGVLKCTLPPSLTHIQRQWHVSTRVSAWLHQRDARSLSARAVGLLWVMIYPLYHRLKYHH
jgi:hypothetical protein